MAPDGSSERCSSHGAGLGIILANKIENNCEKDMAMLGYLPYEEAGAVGITIVKDYRLSRVLKGLPAEKAGLKEGDVIVSVDGKTPADQHDLFTLLFGKKDTKVRVVVRRNGSEMPFEFTRAKISEMVQRK